jgi:catechol 2,3-dioxygenase-like lactoylglutathione lyase family enzyme
MTTTRNIRQITPFMHVRKMADAKAFFVDLLGFTVDFEQAGYMYVERDGITVRVLESDECDKAGGGNRAFRYYVDVEDVDTIYRELKPKLDRLPQGEVFGPIDQPYDQRELCILAPDGDLFVFGAPIKR